MLISIDRGDKNKISRVISNKVSLSISLGTIRVDIICLSSQVGLAMHSQVSYTAIMCSRNSPGIRASCSICNQLVSFNMQTWLGKNGLMRERLKCAEYSLWRSWWNVRWHICLAESTSDCILYKIVSRDPKLMGNDHYLQSWNCTLQKQALSAHLIHADCDFYQC